MLNSEILFVKYEEFLKLVHFDWVRKYGKIFRIWCGSRPVLMVSSPELMETIMSSQKFITKAIEYSHLSSWLGNSMLLTTGNAVIRPPKHLPR